MPRKQPEKPEPPDELEDRLKPTGPESPHAFVQRRMRELHIGEKEKTENDDPKKAEGDKPKS